MFSIFIELSFFFTSSFSYERIFCVFWPYFEIELTLSMSMTKNWWHLLRGAIFDLHHHNILIPTVHRLLTHLTSLLVFLFPSVSLCAISHQPEENIFQELTEPSVIEQGAYILIAAGAFIFIISFLGEWIVLLCIIYKGLECINPILYFQLSNASWFIIPCFYFFRILWGHQRVESSAHSLWNFHRHHCPSAGKWRHTFCRYMFILKKSVWGKMLSNFTLGSGICKCKFCYF